MRLNLLNVLAPLSLASSVLAKVYNMTAPSSAIAGRNITATLLAGDYIQNWDDFGVIWGLVSQKQTCQGCIGEELAYNNIYGTGLSPPAPNRTFTVPIPSGTPAGPHQLVAAVPYLVGASGETGINYFAANVTVTDS